MKEKEEIVYFNKEGLGKSNIRIFSKLEGDKLSYIVSLDSTEKTQSNKERIALATFSQGKLKAIRHQMMRLLGALSEKRVEKTDVDFLINQLASNRDIVLTDEMKEMVSTCTDRDNKDTERISIRRKTKMEEIIPDESIDYNKIDRLLAKNETIDLSKVPEEVIQDVGENAQNRLNTLDSIQSSEEAVLHKDSLESFMRSQEKENSREKILLNCINRIDQLDAKTIIECLKAIEDEDVEYATLYPIYLRIQENRIMDKTKNYLKRLQFQGKDPNGTIEEFLQTLEKQKILDVRHCDLDTVRVGFIRKENNTLEKYLNSDRKIDFEMIKYLNSIEDTEKEEDKEEVLTYLKHRAGSLRQVGKKFSLRQYIETTEFKDEKEAEQNWFLYEVAKVEKKYLLSKYDELFKYNEKKKVSSNLEEYKTELDKAEQDKRKSRDLYEQYSKLWEDRNIEDEEKGVK